MTGYCLTDTIYALASGAGKAGVAVIRVSGPQVLTVLKEMAGIDTPTPRHAYFQTLCASDGSALDHALVLYFKGPHSFTGEDVAELQVHGGPSVITAVCRRLGEFAGVRPAERGEFSRRSVVYGKMDLTAAEGIMDLVDAQTEHQRRQALSQTEGHLGKLYERWRQLLVRHRAYLEAFIDFPEEEIPPEKEAQIQQDVRALIDEIRRHLNDGRTGQRLREGFQITLIGEPNVGKSSLMNALTQKETAIVTPIAGTTRDIVEAHLDVAGFPVILADTAGLREQAAQIEAEGIKRAVRRAEESDLILFVQDIASYPNVTPLPALLQHIPTKLIWNKSDTNPSITPQNGLCLSAKTRDGITALWQEITTELKERFVPTNTAITRERYRTALLGCVKSLEKSLTAPEIELQAEDLRLASREIGRITGQIETEELLDVIFKDFCIGK